MSVRRRALPRGWYPDDPEGIRELVSSWAVEPGPRDARAVVAPHAGWAFSGRLAARAVAALRPSAGLPGPETVVVLGGHLPAGYPALAAREAAYETPLGPIQADLELLSALEAALAPASLEPDEEPDNTVEVLLPLVAATFPGARALWLRAPNDASSLALGAALAASARGRRVACVGSTDLTHYGPSYGFMPRGRGRQAEAWVREENDRRLVEALLRLDGEAAIRLGERERSACSPGAAAAALAFAAASGSRRAELIEYATSLDVRRDESFVGYAALGFFA